MAADNPSYRQYWTEFQRHVQQTSRLLNAPRPSGRNHVHIKIDSVRMDDFKLCAALHLNERWLKSELVVGEDFAADIDQLWRGGRADWRAAMGDGLYWHTDSIKGGKLAVRKHVVDPLDPVTRPDHFRWYVETLEIFHRLLAPIIREIVWSTAR